ncbi:MAG: hypothetical protein FWB80_06500 [Defluviitaleaceae bacterium]|nr:hypothetical protein [Defluviitaleaceae bacterium]
MEKTYKLVTHSDAIPKTEIERLYDGYWVYIVKAKMTETGRLLEGIPVIIGSVPYDGVEDGIYEQYKADNFVERVGISLRHTGFISSLRLAEDSHV